MKTVDALPFYPRKDFDQDKRRKLSQDDIGEMKEWREQGKTYTWIGKEYGVSRQLVKYHTADEEYRIEKNKQRYKLLQKQYELEPELLEKKRKQTNQSFLERTKTDSAAREFKGKHTYAWKKKKYHTDEAFRQKTLSQAKENYNRKNVED